MALAFNERPAPVTYVRGFNNGNIQSGGNPDERYEMGAPAPLRMYVVGRTEDGVFIGQCRFTMSTDFCGGLQISSAKVLRYGNQEWDSGIRLATPFLSTTYVESNGSRGKDVLDRIPYYSLRRNDVEDFALYSMVCGLSTFCHDNTRNGIVYQDRKDGMLDRMAHIFSKMTVCVPNLGIMKIRGHHGREQFLIPEYNAGASGPGFIWRKISTNDPAWVMDASRSRTTFYNRNSENDVVNGTVTYPGGWYHRHDTDREEILNEETGLYEWSESGWGSIPDKMPNRPNAEYSLTPEEVTFLQEGIVVCFMQRCFWNCG